MSTKAEALKGFCDGHPAILVKEDDDAIYLIVVSFPSAEEVAQLTFSCQKEIHIESVPETQYHSLTTARSATFYLDPIEDEPLTTVAYCQKILLQAVQQKASDIHIEPNAKGARIRFRIDGVLHPYTHLNLDETTAIESRFKLLAGVDIAENRRPQDGQLCFTHQEIEYSFRLATLPTKFGEKVVLRLLETFKGDLTLDHLGMPTEQLNLLKKALNNPQGLIIVTGPTGSGKTATLYSALNSLNSTERNLCSVEDPIELVLAGINQTQINLKAGLDFPLILRALLRQDPDIVMIGEIRDNPTADIAIKAAQTGHLVLSTLHTNSTVDTLSRLTQMGIVEYLLASSLKLIIAQRLVRRLCPRCRTPSPEPLAFRPSQPSSQHWLAKGCQHCFSGYSGRVALFELLPIDAVIQNALIQHFPPQQIRDLLKEKKIKDLYEAGIDAVTKGTTTYQEIIRVIGVQDVES
ncbi:Flp pilus assembly complex ATPase component TadA [Rosenbergiella australiborealis]|uniref:Flp pilus assembly complex ATPase component TadA n=1 Tax=Rosenbergiella australiborealis TaxID=1544696 RepID=A0ABS5T227_9GAMM|nr:ATPase, T2SS/T4P/T4SS family [Rosenbergiella australiborealis]MBT0726207.1 Flp pilus assembly complex ATPase component TadA [Rosenbergiella australiborealis]